MGIDYVADWDCAPKQALGVAGIVQRLKARTSAEQALAVARQNGDQRPPSEIGVRAAVMRPTGMEERSVTLQLLFDEAAVLDGYRSHCEGCPANALGRPFGCCGYIAYPIAAATERWLMSLLPEDIATTAGVLLLHAVADHGWDGSYAAELRRQQGIFFESREPLWQRWEPERVDGPALSSDVVFDMLFGVGPLNPAHSRMVALFLGLVPHTVLPADLGALMEEPARFAAALRFPAVPEGQPHLQQLAGFLHTMCVSGALDTTTLIDG
jgi:hypothetical protein